MEYPGHPQAIGAIHEEKQGIATHPEGLQSQARDACMQRRVTNSSTMDRSDNLVRPHSGMEDAHSLESSISLPRKRPARDQRPRSLGAPPGLQPAKKSRACAEPLRPRTDWQKKDRDTWIKAVPQWWCEHRMVHFANKVHRELFGCQGSATILDSEGEIFDCLISMELRNDNRVQYTLQGDFLMLWDKYGIGEGDVLTFRKDPLTAIVSFICSPVSGPPKGHPARTGLRAQTMVEEDADVEEGRSAFALRHTARQAPVHQDRWREVGPGQALKTVYRTNLSHFHCPIPEWLYESLSGQAPTPNCTLQVFDPHMGQDLALDVVFCENAKVHYITGPAYKRWLLDSSLAVGDQILVHRRRDVIHWQRVPVPRTQSEADAGCYASGCIAHGRSASRQGSDEDAGFERFEVLAAVAEDVGIHGTPALLGGGALGPILGQEGVAKPEPGSGGTLAGLKIDEAKPPVKESAGGEPRNEHPHRAALALLEPQQGWGGVAAARHPLPTLFKPRGALPCAASQFPSDPCPPPSSGEALASAWTSLPPLVTQCPPRPAAAQVAQDTMALYFLMEQILACHTWTSEEIGIWTGLKAKLACLDDNGRRICCLNLSTAATDRGRLLDFALSILTLAPTTPPKQCARSPALRTDP
uniref:Uncharacterized protein n=1 Tax=Auxenochlorella protothecoides TaxID=3075 RepID=A0A1D1ZZ63_AUXPR